MTLEELRSTRPIIPVATALATLTFDDRSFIKQPVAAFHYDAPMGPVVVIETTLGFKYAWISDTSHRPSLEDHNLGSLTKCVVGFVPHIAVRAMLAAHPRVAAA